MGTLKDALLSKNIVEQFESPSQKSAIVCDIHGPYNGFTTVISGKEVNSICPDCLELEILEEKAETYKAQQLAISEAKIKTIFARSSFPKIFNDISFEDYIPSNDNAVEVLRRMKRYATSFKKVREVGSSVVFLGGTGTGKSMLSAAVGNAVMIQGFTVLYLTCPQAISLIKRSWTKDSKISQDEYLEKFEKPDLLILDEVPKGCTSKSDWEMIHEMMNRRYMEQKPTISISTLSEEELKKKMTEEIMRRMYYKGDIMRFNWERHKETGLLW